MWREDNHALFKLLKGIVREHMARIGRLCAARCAELLLEAGGPALEKFHLETRFVRASSTHLEAAQSSSHEGRDRLVPSSGLKGKMLPLPLPVAPSWSNEQTECDKKRRNPSPVTHSRSSESAKQLLESPDLIIRQDHKMV